MPAQALVLGGTNSSVALFSELGAVASPFTGNQAPAASFTIADGQFGLHGGTLTLASAERGTLEGTGRLVILG